MKNLTRWLLLALLFLGNGFADDGKLSSTIFFEYSMYSEKNASNQNGFEVKRAYLTYQHEISQTVDFKIQTDVGRQKDSLNTGLYTYLKNAYMSWKSAYGTLTVGLQCMNQFKVQEKTWGYRFIEKSAMDRKKFSSSADLGIGFSRAFGQSVFIDAMVTNGGGYKKAETDRFKKYSLLLGSGSQRLDKEQGYNVGLIFSYESYRAAATNKRIIGGAFAGVSLEKLRAGVEINLLNDSGNNGQEKIISLYTDYKLSSKLHLFGRADRFEEGSQREDYLILGLVGIANKNLMVAPNVRWLQNETSARLYDINFLFKF